MTLVQQNASNSDNSVYDRNSTVVSLPKFTSFDPNVELWKDYWARFTTFTEAHSVPDNKKTHIFLTNKTTVIYKMLANLASQSQPSKDIHALKLNEICEFMD